MISTASRKEFLFFYSPVIIIVALIKWRLIQYGLPYSTHVDEMVILTDPFKIMQTYAQGNFSISTNLYNWVCLSWYGISFLIGQLLGYWSGVEGFKTFLISGSSDFLLTGRLLSLVLSLLGTIVLIRIVSRLDTTFFLKSLAVIIIAFNPFEINTTNWAKFDSFSYLMYAVLLHEAYFYFIERKTQYRSRLYILLFIGLATRIELIAFLVGFIAYDILFFPESKSLGAPVKPLVIGVALYSIITLVPVSFLFNILSPQVTQLVVTQSFFDAILSKLPDAGSLLRNFADSGYYLICLVALLGPLLFVELFRNRKKKELQFLYMPLAIMAIVLAIFPVKNVHYLLGISVLIIFGYVICVVTAGQNSWTRIGLFITVFWVVSYSLQLIFLLIVKGDVRLEAREYLLDRTIPGELIYTDGIFADINDTPERYLIKSEASRLIGGTGLSNEYVAGHINGDESRAIVSVSDWDPFKSTIFENKFNNNYDTSKLHYDHPSYYIYVAHGVKNLKFSESPFYREHGDYYNFLSMHYAPDNVFSYTIIDPRLYFANAYYFRPVSIFRKKKNW